jgi:TetR/AcrR family fatty acid metabolism transcriptional regulator
MSPKLVDRERKTKEITQAALSLFSQKGYAATSVGQIAKTAGIGKGTIYEYYKTKADIFIAALREWTNRFEERLLKHLEDIENPIRKLHALAEMNIELVDPLDSATAQLSVEFLQQSLLENGILFKRRYLLKEMHAGQCRMVVNILLDGISKGLFRPEIARDAEKIAINLLAYFDGVRLHSITSESYFDLKEQTYFYLNNLIRSIQSSGSQLQTTY